MPVAQRLRLSSWLLWLLALALSLGWAHLELTAATAFPAKACGLQILAIYVSSLLMIAAMSVLAALLNALSLRRQKTTASRIRRLEPWLLSIPALLGLLWMGLALMF